ncbi:MAG: DnaJ family domain-containing protein [Pseudomonadota bacterium]|nr:DnaJ family domain-containing protein [Pseudomonadota bacterium]
MHWFDELVEQRIADALRQGAFEDLAGQGRPLELECNALVPDELRMAYRVLKNANCLPPELETRRQVQDLESFISRLDETDENARNQARRKLNLLLIRLEAERGHRAGYLNSPEYHAQLLRQLAEPDPDSPVHTPPEDGRDRT